MTGLAFGVLARPERGGVAELEALPIDSLWVGGHVASPNASPEALMGLAQLAVQSTRVRIGTSILLLPLYTPAIVAKQIADLDRISGGRITLGVGIGGEYPAEFRACQVPMSERASRADEAIPLLRQLWTGEPVTRAGRHYPVDDVRIQPTPAQPGGPPIVVAGRREPAMRRAARLGDGWMPYLYSPRKYAESVDTITSDARENGRDLAGFEWFVFLFTHIDDDGDVAREHLAQYLGGAYGQDFRAMVSSVAAAGTAREVRDRYQQMIDAGARHVIVAPVTGDRVATVSRLFDEVVPSLEIP